MNLLCFWFSLAAYTLIWTFSLQRAVHAPARVLIGFYGGWIWLLGGTVGLCWTAASVYQWF